ncbi:dethiobiotin synthase [Actimicrobium sp. CCI2.3]|uniref:dethiobiotin synthase n=1 Tax=Actimicrobium sp. CCI2.3 TaxID=3048616 RepID=UPI002AB4DE5C|nr:dethiobiotin synthase [Actimicrobium sp. CCI2.3]MDY7575064.1 dethiobiotin synthase [Actimicrobium sp. CCI2.3]MEB0022596.1 dethiobiotin synthase [Actimicrobium sp. CCI2.3]
MSARFACFVTGTDTGVGKSLVSAALLHLLVEGGLGAVGMKPVAAGAVLVDGRLINDDVEQLAAAGNLSLPAALRAPYILEAAAAPHIAAAREGVTISMEHLLDCYHQLAASAETVVVEGVGGFCVPLSDVADTADLAQQLGLPVILVVGMRLGCLSHALLTAEAIRTRGLHLAGWVANLIEPDMDYLPENIAALVERLRAPLLGELPALGPQPSAAHASSYLNAGLVTGWPLEKNTTR